LGLASETLRSFFLVVFKGLLFPDFAGNLNRSFFPLVLMGLLFLDFARNLNLLWLINLFNGSDVYDCGLGVIRLYGGVN
jgi:hypothetical protein